MFNPSPPDPSNSSPGSGPVCYGDILAKTSIQPTPHLRDLAQQANVPGGNGYAEDDPYDPVAIALYWSQIGKVMPLKSPKEIERGDFSMEQGGKIPSFKGGQWEQGTRDPEVVKRWWGEDPQRGVGILTQANRTLVVDIDNGRGFSGELEFMELAEELGLDTTQVACSKSPSYRGGWHLYWRLPPGFPKMSLPAVSVIADHVDIPWYVVAPGSWKLATKGYDRKEKAIKGIGFQTWVAGDPLNLPMAPKPLLEKLKRCGVIKGIPAIESTRSQRERYRTDKFGTIDVDFYDKHGIPLGQQNATLYRIACKMAGDSMRIPQREAVEWCWKIITRSPSDHTKGEWKRSEVEKTVNGAYEYVITHNAAQTEFATQVVNNLRKNATQKGSNQ